jgi:hypothetical protein
MAMRRPRARSTPTTELFRATTFAYVWNEYVEDYGVRPNLTRQEFLDRQSLGWWGRPRPLPNYKSQRHLDGQATYYFYGTPNQAAPYTLAIIDIDVGKILGKGSTEGAVAFARHLRRTQWPTLCWELSRSGKGLGCPVLVRKEGRSPREVNAALKRLERWLQAEARRVGADIENVEVKGTLPIITYKRGRAVSIQYGQAARYPRSLTAGQLLDSPVLSTDEWLLKEVCEPAAKQHTKTARPVGSVTGHPVGKDELDLIPHYERLYRRLVGADLKANARFTVTAHDFAVACVLLRFFKKNPNKDGTLPTRRAQALWTALYEAGPVQRPWNDRRWKRIRDWLSESGHIDWQDNSYQAPNPAQGLKAVASKWCITDEFFEVLESVKQTRERGSFVDTVEVKKGAGERLQPRLCLIQRETEAVFWSDADSRLEMLLAA